MPDKRKQTSSIPSGSPYAKRTRPSYAGGDEEELSAMSSSHERPRNHPVYGMKSAFPGLDDPVGDELFYGPPEDGLEYLRMVRSEANSLPALFVAPKVSETSVETTTQDEEDRVVPSVNRYRFYADGVYVAPPVNTTNGVSVDKSEIEEPQIDAQSSYYNLLRHRFLLLRSTLKCQPPASAIAGLDDLHPISLPRGSKAARSEWRRLLLSVDPQMVQLACMDMDSVLGVLGIMGRLMSENVRSGDAVRVRRIGAWAWGLLGRCREVGQLGSEEVSEIRDLGKRAAKILAKMRETKQVEMTEAGGSHQDEKEESDGEDNDEEPDVAQGEPADITEGRFEGIDTTDLDPMDISHQDAEATEPTPEDLEAAKARLQTRLELNHEPEPEQSRTSDTSVSYEEAEVVAEAAGEGESTDATKQTRAMLDMIITVVGEFYGQRDLLDQREIWDEDMQW